MVDTANCWNGRRCTAIFTARRASRSRRRSRQGRDVLFDIDWQGTQQLREKARDDVVSVFVLPPSAAELEKRLHTRAQDDEVIRGRMATPADEMSHWAEYDYVVVNRDLDEAFAEVQSILTAERLKRERRPGCRRSCAVCRGSLRLRRNPFLRSFASGRLGDPCQKPLDLT